MVKSKTSRIEIRVNEETKKLIDKAARLNGETISSYILSKSLSSAKEDVERMETITLNNEESDLFFSLLSDPPEPNEALKNLFK